MSIGRSRLLLLAGIAAALVGSGARPATAQACTCLPADLATLYNRSDSVLRVRVLTERVRGADVTASRIYTAEVLATYKGCLEPRERVRLVTSVQSGLCGITLAVGGDYLVTGRRRGLRRALDVGSCGWNVPFSSLTAAEVEFLETRYNCCGDRCECVGRDLVQCFVNPCDVASCPEGACTANYCGGCFAEFADPSGAAVCQRRPYQHLGGRCGAFTLPDEEQQCAPGATCEPLDPRIPDLGGRCRRICQDSSDCPDTHYCAASVSGLVGAGSPVPVELGVCRRDGSCANSADCSRPGNFYPVILCVGETTCEQGRCGVRCGVFPSDR